MNKLIEYCKRNSPPGIDLKQEYAVFIIGNCCSAVLAVFSFLINYIKHRESLFAYVSTQRILIDGAVMTPFYKLNNYCFSGFFFVALFMLGYVIYHYMYFRHGSMSIYLMKRLPSKTEFLKRVWTVPLTAIICTLAIAVATLLFCYIVYFFATPKICLPIFIFFN